MTAHVIERLGHLGDGIAPGPVFAALTLPGETVAGEVDGDRISAPRILVPSPERVAPPCRHFKTCGGCALQHGSDAFVADWKVSVVTTALAAHDLPSPVRRRHTSPAQTRRRATLSGRRTKSGALIGFHKRASEIIVEIPDCQLLHPDLLAARPALEALVVLGGSRKAEMAFALTRSEAGVDVAVTGGKPLDPDLRARLSEAVGQHALARLTWDGEWIAERAVPVQSFDGIAVVPPAGGFLQATQEGEAALRSSVSEAVGAATRIADLFAGCGTFALPLSRQARVWALESHDAALGALRGGWQQASGLKTVTAERRDLFRNPVTAEELAPFEAAVIDPPRAGAEDQMRQLAESTLPRVATVSCNPVTFARDARVLTRAGFTLDWIDVIDQFRWSPHVEIVAQMTRRPTAR